MELDMNWTLGLEASDGCPWKMPVSATPWLREPDGLTSETGALVAAGNAVGLPVLPPDDGTAVGAALAAGVAVAEDPQANSRATNNRTIALGQCLTTAMLDPGLVMVLTPVATVS
jgi:hypothetical protein